MAMQNGLITALTAKKIEFQKSNMADGCHLKKLLIHYISVLPIYMKHDDAYWPTTAKEPLKFRFKKIQDCGGRHIGKIEKWLHSNGLRQI